MRHAVLVAWFCACLTLCIGARAEDRRVVVLKPRALTAAQWREGTQTVTAELSLGDYQLLVRSSDAQSVDDLVSELRTAATELDTVGAVAVVRQGELGVALVWTRRDTNVARIEAVLSQGAVAAGAVALRVAELLRQRTLNIPLPELSAPPKPVVESSPAAPEKKAPVRRTVWFGGGAIASSDAGPIRPILLLSSRWPVGGPMAIDATGMLSPGRFRLETQAGSVDVFAGQLTLHAMFQLVQKETLGFSVGLGGGGVWVDEIAAGDTGFSGQSDATRVGLLSTKISGTIHADPVSFLLALETGMMVPPVSINVSDGAEGGQHELARLGRPWASFSMGAGWRF